MARKITLKRWLKLIKLANLSVGEEDVRQQSLGVIGQRFSGKTHAVQKLLPQLKSQLVILDPEGQYRSFAFDPPKPIRDTSQARWFAEYALRYNRSVVLNHKYHTESKAIAQTSSFLAYYYRYHNKRPGQPKPVARESMLIVDEAYFYAPERGVPDFPSKGMKKGLAEYWVYTIQARGRNRGIGAIIVTQRPAQVSKHILNQCGLMLIFRLRHPNDRRWLRDFGLSKDQIDQVSNFNLGECLAVGFESEPYVVQIPA